MIKLRAGIICLILILLFSSCDKSNKIADIDLNKEIKEITISTLPPQKDSPKTVQDKDKINEIAHYLYSLNLKAATNNADDYEGMSYIIQITYIDDSKKDYIHFGNKFFKEAGGAWREIEYKQAEQFSSIYDNL